ncbi:MAG: SURF1 family protein [Phyllobacteriaceae bacterium]|nr:SURF1 family protein [Phyllobacteriaceae bacterium]
MKTRRFPFSLWLAALPVFAALVALGVWQVNRLAWKEGLLAEIHARIAAPAEPVEALDARHAASGDVDYFPLVAKGVYCHDLERHFLSTHKGEAGFFVYTPLVSADSRILFVNRGFVPYERKDAATRAEGQVAGEVEVMGLARDAPAAKPGFLVPENDTAKNVFYWKDIAAMAASAGLDSTKLRPYFLDAGSASNPGGLPVGGVTLIDLPNSHLQYAGTWFGLAAVLAAIVGIMTARRMRSRQP